MIIVSQDKRNVLNFDFTQRIGLDRETREYTPRILKDLKCAKKGKEN